MIDSESNPFEKKSDEPLFMAISNDNVSFQQAYESANRSLSHFVNHMQSKIEATFSAKLRFRDPEQSERLGEDRFIFLWLSGVSFCAEEEILSGVFFEVPPSLQKWFEVGQRLGFKKEDIFDWMVLTSDGHLFGGYTLRVSRSNLSENQREDFDKHIGVRRYEPNPL